MRKIHYYNLTQTHGRRNVYLRSTDVEQMNYVRLLWSVPDEWLYLWSQGRTIVLHDVTSNRKSKVGHIFIPVLVDVLDKFYFHEQLVRNDIKEHVITAWVSLNHWNGLYRKYRFWKGKIKEIKLEAKIKYVKREKNPLDKSNKEAYNKRKHGEQNR